MLIVNENFLILRHVTLINWTILNQRCKQDFSRDQNLTIKTKTSEHLQDEDQVICQAQ